MTWSKSGTSAPGALRPFLFPEAVYDFFCGRTTSTSSARALVPRTPRRIRVCSMSHTAAAWSSSTRSGTAVAGAPLSLSAAASAPVSLAPLSLLVLGKILPETRYILSSCCARSRAASCTTLGVMVGGFRGADRASLSGTTPGAALLESAVAIFCCLLASAMGMSSSSPPSSVPAITVSSAAFVPLAGVPAPLAAVSAPPALLPAAVSLEQSAPSAFARLFPAASFSSSAAVVGGGTAAVGDAKTGQNSRRNSDRRRAASSSLDRTRDPPQSALESVLRLVGLLAHVLVVVAAADALSSPPSLAAAGGAVVSSSTVGPTPPPAAPFISPWLGGTVISSSAVEEAAAPAARGPGSPPFDAIAPTDSNPM